MKTIYLILSLVGVLVWFAIVLTVADFVLGRIISRAGKENEE